MSTMSLFFSRYVQQLTWFNSSSLAMASRMCRGVTRPFLLSLAALPANSKISATWVKEKVKIEICCYTLDEANIIQCDDFENIKDIWNQILIKLGAFGLDADFYHENA